MSPQHSPPPILTVTEELLHWSLDRTASLPKSHRFTFGQKIDHLMVACLEKVITARYSPGKRAVVLRALNLDLEVLRALWRIIHAREWISQSQLFFVSRKIDEIGRMAGAWLKASRKR